MLFLSPIFQFTNSLYPVGLLGSVNVRGSFNLAAMIFKTRKPFNTSLKTSHFLLIFYMYCNYLYKCVKRFLKLAFGNNTLELSSLVSCLILTRVACSGIVCLYRKVLSAGTM